MSPTEVLESVIDYYSFEFDDSPTPDDVDGVAEWLNNTVVTGGIHTWFAQIYDGESIKLVAFSRPISKETLVRFKSEFWAKCFDDLGARIRGKRV